MDFIPPLPCPKDAPLQLAHNLDNHLQLSLMDTRQSPEETPRCLQHKSPPPHSGRPLVRLRHERINPYPHRSTPRNDNNPQTTSKAVFTPVPVRVPVPFRSRSTRSCCVHTCKNWPDPFRLRACDVFTLVPERDRNAYGPPPPSTPGF